MDSDCRAMHERLAEVAGAVTALAETDRRHLAGCARCRAVAAAEAGLAAVLARAVPPAAPALQQSILAAVAGARRRRRLLAFLPVAASLVLCCFGLALLGGLPGSGAFGLLPQWSAQGPLAVAAAIRDWQVVVSAAARSVATLLSPLTLVVAGLAAVAGAAALVAAAGGLRRRLEGVAWRRDR